MIAMKVASCILVLLAGAAAAVDVTIPDTIPNVLALDTVHGLNTQYLRDVRVEKFDDDYFLVHHNASVAIGRLGGAARAYLEDGIAQREAVLLAERDEDCVDCGGLPHDCYHRTCVTVNNCGDFCTFCYPIYCV